MDDTNASDIDVVTGLMSIKNFHREAERYIIGSRDYYLIYFNTARISYIRDVFGDQVVKQIMKELGSLLKSLCRGGECASVFSSDNFVILKQDKSSKDLFIINLISRIRAMNLPFELMCNFGIYEFTGEPVSITEAIENATFAESKIRGNYTVHSCVYTPLMRAEYMSENEILTMFDNAIRERHFLIYFQAQYDHSTGRLVGAEGLVRWKHPEKGVISPAVFIPVLENTGLISVLDYYVFEQACNFIRYCLDNNIHLVPISTNFSRYDLLLTDFVKQLEMIRRNYGVPAKYLRIEITESVVADSLENTNRVVDQLHKCGYTVEMDDFGSGFSSLNVLKDVDFDIIKLDMRFMEHSSRNKRGGLILTAIIRMAQWLNLPVIAEGVETLEQADFLLSIGCECIQGFLYAKPVSRDDFEIVLRKAELGKIDRGLIFTEKLDSCNFWDPHSMETLIFSNFVGPAAILSMQGDQVKISRVNEKYVQELYMNSSQQDIVVTDFLDCFDEENRNIYLQMLERAKTSAREEECETWRNLRSNCCGESSICIRTSVRVIAKGPAAILFYAMIRNVTVEKKELENYKSQEKKFRHAVEHAKVYFWEYTIATKEMRPCFRCMRDLGLPAVVQNYPEPLIESGIFPADYADMYRDMMKKIDGGAPELEVYIPLTSARIPFIIRYTTEFDSVGNPIKAFGSATMVNGEKSEQKSD